MKYITRLTFAVIFFAMLSVSCESEKTLPDTLSVEPASPIVFNASDNEDVLLSVESSNADYNVSNPEWVIVRKEDGSLFVNASDNESGFRSGFIVISSGSAKPVTISVSQKAEWSSPSYEDMVKASLLDESGVNAVNLKIGIEDFSANVFLELENPCDVDTEVELYVDSEYVDEKSFADKTDYVLLPGAKVKEMKIVIPAGKTVSEKIEVSSDKGGWELQPGIKYMLPIAVKSHSDYLVFEKTDRVCYHIEKNEPKKIRNLLYFETNDTNPLNALEYVLEDGTMFFDAVVLFSANINYNRDADRVYLHTNASISALIEANETYLQPLRKKGIKVYLGLLGNHDPAGLCRLSDWGAQAWAQIVAEFVEENKLDGVALDDEYSTTDYVDSKWLVDSPSYQQGSRLCYELKKAMSETTTSRPTDVIVFNYHMLGEIYNVTDLETQQEHVPGDFVDIRVPNYGGRGEPLEGMTLQNCCADSFELNKRLGSISEDTARMYKESGYGWCMWYAFNPAPGHPTENLDYSLNLFKKAARGFYDQELLDPKGYYKAEDAGNGVFNPERYEF